MTTEANFTYECHSILAFIYLAAYSIQGRINIATGHCAFTLKKSLLVSLRTCRAPCNDQIYNSRIAFASYPNRALFSKRPEICPLITKLVKICSGWIKENAIPVSGESFFIVFLLRTELDILVGHQDYGDYPDAYSIKRAVLLSDFPNMCDLLSGLKVEDDCGRMRKAISPELDAMLLEYARRNLLWLNVYVKVMTDLKFKPMYIVDSDCCTPLRLLFFQDSFSTHIVRDEKMTRTSFVANVGGLLGLCMGFSLVSVAEILYYMFKRQTLVACRRGVVARQQRAISRRRQSRMSKRARKREQERGLQGRSASEKAGEQLQQPARSYRRRKRWTISEERELADIKDKVGLS